MDYGPEFVPNFIQMKFELFRLWTWIFLKKLGVGTKVLLWKFWWGQKVRENVVPRLLALDKKHKYLAINKKQ